VIFIGEIRDRETAEIAIQAALTGHLVLSTLHTNNAVGAITRFLDMGVPDYLLASSILGVSAQRLVRRLCTHCREAVTIPSHFAERFSLPTDQIVYIAQGCHHCANTGFHGRIPIAEYKDVNPELRTAIVQNPSTVELEAAAALTQPRNMIDDGIAKVLAGTTTFEEVIRIAG
jgi:type II secretory ATPase GspE/PulE/Tfp pilus assembly ATPase PilB-like protein